MFWLPKTADLPILPRPLDADVAQVEEQRIRNAWVGDSSRVCSQANETTRRAGASGPLEGRQ